jgi:hypothetical protein
LDEGHAHMILDRHLDSLADIQLTELARLARSPDAKHLMLKMDATNRSQS